MKKITIVLLVLLISAVCLQESSKELAPIAGSLSNCSTPSGLFTASLVIDKKDQNQVPYIMYNVALLNPLYEMKNVKISYLLQEQMATRLKTPTIMYAPTGEKRVINLDPVKVNRYEVFLALPLSGAAVDEVFMNQYNRISLQVDWTSADGFHHQDCLFVEGSPTLELSSFLNSKQP
ncbi:hypothetical protein [Gorillibacterium sp. sgz5001074]|uniref:hypothetical protein n=1 Tax=Gorillibacterium sp. sgz5001074 TaxID=3446695 RepID=UPI003F67352C